MRSHRGWSWLAATLAIALAPAAALASESAHGSTAINWWAANPRQPAVGWLLVDFALFLLLLVVFARRPLREFVRSRALRIKKAIDESNGLRSAAETTAGELAQRLTDLDRELRELRDEIVRSGERERAQLQTDAAQAVERMRRDVVVQIESESTRVRAELQAETMRQAIALAEQVLRARLTTADHQRLGRAFVDTFARTAGGDAP